VATDRFFVKNLTLENFRCFEKVELGPFDPHFNLLVGTNGSGKSSVLLALANLFRPLALGEIAGESLLGERDVRISYGAIRVAVTPTSVLSRWGMSSEFDWNEDSFVASESFNRIAKKEFPTGTLWRTPPGGRNLTDALVQVENWRVPWPGLIAFYSTDRRFLSAQDVTNRTSDSSDGRRNPAFANWENAGLNIDAFREWIRRETLISLQEGGLTKYSAPEIAELKEHGAAPTISLLRIVQDAICKAFEGAKTVEYVERRKDIVVQFESGVFEEFSKMSDGQRALVGLIGDIARRLASIYEVPFGLEALTKAPGLVLIDELDLHLHPRWQRRVVGDLKRIFPNIQFFATTHSPQIIGEARPEEIVMLTPNGQKRPTASYGMNSDWVLKCVMETEDRDPGVAMEIKSLFDEIEDGKFDEARTRIERLRREIGEMPDLVGAESYIWRVEHEDEEAAE
jgi:predicted ATP-binding protein involved in virulence